MLRANKKNSTNRSSKRESGIQKSSWLLIPGERPSWLSPGGRVLLAYYRKGAKGTGGGEWRQSIHDVGFCGADDRTVGREQGFGEKTDGWASRGRR